jgi:hypothetical protein
MPCTVNSMSGLEGDIWRFMDDDGVRDVRDYFHSGRYSGAHFNELRGGGDREETKNYFEADDLLAVSMLSVVIPRDTCWEILESRREALHDLLKLIPVAVTLWDDESLRLWIGRDKPGWKLWADLVHDKTEGITGVGWVTANKLLARKRPELFPVYDQVVKAALQPHSRNFWEPLREDLRKEQNKAVKRLQAIRQEAGVPEVPLLRVLDVAVWMREWGRGPEQP